MNIRRIQLFAWLSILAIACENGETDESVVTEEAPVAVEDSPVAEAEGVAATASTQMATRALNLMGDSEIAALTATQVELSVRYESNGIPIVSERIEFKLVDSNGNEAPTGIGGSLLESQNALTDTMGVATMRLLVGSEPGTFSVEASAPGADPMLWLITVEDSGLGGFEVRLVYAVDQGRYNYSHFHEGEVFLFDQKQCDAVNPSQIFGALLSATRSPFNEVQNLVQIGNLPRDQVFSIAGVAYNSDTKVVSYGCVDAQAVVGGEMMRVELQLQDVPLQFKGRFNLRHTFDLARAFRNSQNDTLVRLEQVLSILRLLGSGSGDRGDAVVQLFCDLARTDLCTDVVFITRFGGAVIDRMIDNVIAPDSPQVFTVFQALSDLVSLVYDMSVLGQFEFVDSFPDSEGYLRQNEDRWQRFEFSWQTGCPAEAECTRQFTLAEIHSGRTNNREYAVFSPFDARVQGNNMEIGEHQLVVRFGLIMLGLAERWVIPEVVEDENAVTLTLERVVADLLPCGRVDDALQDTGFCQDILVEGLSDALVEVVADFSFPDDLLTLKGTVSPVDEDGDLVIDGLENGRWEGRFGEDNNFFGCFNGCRGFECEPRSCTPPQN